MHKRFVSIYFSASLACMIPFPGRFAYGLILASELFVLVFGATLFRAAIRKLEFVRSGNLFFMVFVIFLTMLFRQILAALLPIAALSAGFALYRRLFFGKRKGKRKIDFKTKCLVYGDFLRFRTCIFFTARSRRFRNDYLYHGARHCGKSAF